MPHTLERSATPWQAGAFHGRVPQLLFGTMYEDPQIELQAFAPQCRVFCIAGAGSTARALAANGHRVTAVDINPENHQRRRPMCVYPAWPQYKGSGEVNAASSFTCVTGDARSQTN